MAKDTKRVESKNDVTPNAKAHMQQVREGIEQMAEDDRTGRNRVAETDFKDYDTIIEEMNAEAEDAEQARAKKANADKPKAQPEGDMNRQPER